MANIDLSFAIGSNPRSRPIISGRVKAQGIDLHCSTIHASELFWRQLTYREFELSEMSMSSLLMAISRGIDTFVGIPIFTTRNFFHTGVLIQRSASKAPPTSPESASACLSTSRPGGAPGAWILQHNWPRPQDCTGLLERPPEKSHGGATGFDPSEIGIDLQYIPRDTDMGAMLESGELDAALHYLAGTGINSRRPPGEVFGAGRGVRPPQRALSRRAISRRPASIPSTTASRFAGTCSRSTPGFRSTSTPPSSRPNRSQRPNRLGPDNGSLLASGRISIFDTGTVGPEVQQALAHDLFPYGVQDNRELLETILLYSYEQGLSARKLALEDVFYAPTLEL